jgi:DNA-binding CsgD family transcriptional regulator
VQSQDPGVIALSGHSDRERAGALPKAPEAAARRSRPTTRTGGAARTPPVVARVGPGLLGRVDRLGDPSRAYLLAAEGKPEAALDVLRECERFEKRWETRSGLVPVAWRSQAALCHLTLGDRAEARALAGEELALARRFGAQRAIGVALRVHGLVHDGDQEARALIDLGSAIRRAGKRADARAPLAEGADLAHRCGATALVQHARDELRLAGARPRRIAQTGRDALTPAELRVVELAAQGNSNKQIAQALFVTLRTVEMHLSNSYRKLDIETREQLPAALSGA